MQLQATIFTTTSSLVRRQSCLAADAALCECEAADQPHADPQPSKPSTALIPPHSGTGEQAPRCALDSWLCRLSSSRRGLLVLERCSSTTVSLP